MTPPESTRARVKAHQPEDLAPPQAASLPAVVVVPMTATSVAMLELHASETKST